MNPAAHAPVGVVRRPQQPVHVPEAVRPAPAARPVVNVQHVNHAPRGNQPTRVVPNYRGRHVEHAPVGAGRPSFWNRIFVRRQPNVVFVDNRPRDVRPITAKEVLINALIITAVAVAVIAVIAVAAII